MEVYAIIMIENNLIKNTFSFRCLIRAKDMFIMQVMLNDRSLSRDKAKEAFKKGVFANGETSISFVTHFVREAM